MIKRYGERVDPAMHYTPRPGAYVILQRGHDLLLTVQDGTRLEHPEIQLPGGGIDAGEQILPALHREVMEETGFEVRAENLVGINSVTRDNSVEAFQSIQIIYHAQIIGGKLRFEEQGTTDMLEWHSLASVADLQVVGMVRAALAMLPA